ncbi:hypothetical protein [Halomonas marinisediminis]|uniref:DUF2484 family protein n=1 Tax=Halomonas marinisediminis TaxID=2546095 RepID=A0ABY2DA28_9GAMM|nr:hypothetical protein [Halomonas marinisediminis]TDB04744.1 hypothetical protein E0702_04275 [Halomonas marinisediminis]
MTSRTRPILAVAAWCLVAVALVLPLVWLINNRDWGVGLILLAPLLVYGLMRLGRSLESWARASAPPKHPQRR